MTHPVQNENWYNKPTITGEIWARQTFERVLEIEPLANTDAQKEIFAHAFDMTRTDWHYWGMCISKADIARAKRLIKNYGKESWVNAFIAFDKNHSMCKTKFYRWLEWMSYREDPEYWQAKYARAYMYLGMSRAECIARCGEYFEKRKIEFAE